MIRVGLAWGFTEQVISLLRCRWAKIPSMPETLRRKTNAPQSRREQNKAVLEIRAQAKELPFPRYVKFFRRLGELTHVYPSWERRLGEAKGVYLLTFEDGMQYVGSATGENGFWQRWQNYLATGHGGNKVLIRDNRDARTAMVSILEVSGSADTEREIVEQEMLWQRKLGTRAKPLDDIALSWHYDAANAR
jgi:hypothetical protein